MVDFRMPSLGADMEAGTLVEWLVQARRPGQARRHRRRGRDAEGRHRDRDLRGRQSSSSWSTSAARCRSARRSRAFAPTAKRRRSRQRRAPSRRPSRRASAAAPPPPGGDGTCSARRRPLRHRRRPAPAAAAARASRPRRAGSPQERGIDLAAVDRQRARRRDRALPTSRAASAPPPPRPSANARPASTSTPCARRSPRPWRAPSARSRTIICSIRSTSRRRAMAGGSERRPAAGRPPAVGALASRRSRWPRGAFPSSTASIATATSSRAGGPCRRRHRHPRRRLGGAGDPRRRRLSLDELMARHARSRSAHARRPLPQLGDRRSDHHRLQPRRARRRGAVRHDLSAAGGDRRLRQGRARPWVVDGGIGPRSDRHRHARGRPPRQRRPCRRAFLAEIGNCCRSPRSYDRQQISARSCSEELGNIAPEIDLATLDPPADLREALDIDSMDFLNFVIAVHHRLEVDVPELDYPKLVTLDGAVAYLHSKVSRRSTFNAQS